MTPLLIFCVKHRRWQIWYQHPSLFNLRTSCEGIYVASSVNPYEGPSALYIRGDDSRCHLNSSYMPYMPYTPETKLTRPEVADALRAQWNGESDPEAPSPFILNLMRSQPGVHIIFAEAAK